MNVGLCEGIAVQYLHTRREFNVTPSEGSTVRGDFEYQQWKSFDSSENQSDIFASEWRTFWHIKWICGRGLMGGRKARGNGIRRAFITAERTSTRVSCPRP
jgi:hypothetical protein